MTTSPSEELEHDAGLGAERAVRFQGGKHVHAVGGVHTPAGGIQHAFADHVAGAVEAFLAGLEHQDDVAGQLVPAFGQEGGGSCQHGGVQVVAAGVHGAVDPGRVVHARLLLHRQAVHVRAQQHGRAGARVGSGRLARAVLR